MCSSMAEPAEATEPHTNKPHHQKLNPENNNQSKFYNNFLYKVALAVVFFVILPLFPSQAPEFISQSLITRSWELLHLLLVGIAVSYGLFGRLSEKADKETSVKFDSNAHNYVSRILEVPSVFDDEAETSSSSSSLSNELDESNKVQHAWSSRYFRNEPEVVVAQEHSVVDERPLLLPVRSLKQENNESLDEARSSSRRVSSKSVKARGGENGGVDKLELEEKLKESVVLPSPIPWRSRSGRLMQEKNDEPFSSTSTPSSPKLSPSGSFSSPKKAHPAASSPMEAQSKSGEDVGRKRSFYKAAIPPPPPPPPMFYKSSSLRPRSDEVSYGKDLRSFISSESRANAGIEGKHRLGHVDGISMVKSVRTTRGGEQGYANEIKMEQSAKEIEANSVENVTRKRVELDESSFWNSSEKLSHESSSIANKLKSPHFEEFSEEDEKEDLFVKVVMESDEESESEDDETEGGDIVGSPKPSPMPYQAASSSASDAGPDVDKKADEFIAKFREQIRLQRIDSIKKSTAQISKNLPR